MDPAGRRRAGRRPPAGLPGGVRDRRRAGRRRHRPRAADPARRRSAHPRLPRPAVAAEHLLPLLQPAAPADRARGRAPDRRRLRRPLGARGAARRRADRRGPLRPLAAPRPRPRWRSSSTTPTTGAAWPPCCSSTWRSRAREVGLTGVHRVGAAREPEDDRRLHPGRVRDGHPLRRRRRRGAARACSPTPEAEAAIEARARTAAAEAVRRLLSPRSVAVIGAEPRAGHASATRWSATCSAAGFAGPGVAGEPERRPRRQRCAPCRASSTSPTTSTSPSIAVPAASVAARGGGVRAQAGVRRRDPVGRLRRGRARRARRSRPRCCGWRARGASAWSGPNCLGHHQHRPGRAPARHVRPRARRAGARVAAVGVRAWSAPPSSARPARRASGISSFVALGNRADVSGNDLLQYWEGDEHTDVVVHVHRELRQPRHFSRLARRLTPCQAGRGREGRLAADLRRRRSGATRPRTRSCARPA